MSCPIESAIIGAANLILGLCLGYYISKRQQREFARYAALLKIKESLITDKVRLINEVPNKPIMGNISTVQVAIENIKSIFRNRDISCINAEWDNYYKNERNRNPFEDTDQKRKSGAIKAIDSIINFIEKNG